MKQAVDREITVEHFLQNWAETVLRGRYGPIGYPGSSTVHQVQLFNLTDEQRQSRKRPLTAQGKEKRSMRPIEVVFPPMVEFAERVIVGPMYDDDGVNVSISETRSDFFLVLMAEYLSIVPVFMPESWRLMWRQKRFERAQMQLDTAGMKFERRPRRNGESVVSHRARLARCLGISSKARARGYERWLEAARIYVGLIAGLI